MPKRPEFEREQSMLRRYYGLPTVLGGRGLRRAWQRMLWLFLGMVVLVTGGFLIAELITRIF